MCSDSGRGSGGRGGSWGCGGGGGGTAGCPRGVATAPSPSAAASLPGSGSRSCSCSHSTVAAPAAACSTRSSAAASAASAATSSGSGSGSGPGSPPPPGPRNAQEELQEAPGPAAAHPLTQRRLSPRCLESVTIATGSTEEFQGPSRRVRRVERTRALRTLSNSERLYCMDSMASSGSGRTKTSPSVAVAFHSDWIYLSFP
ncbi:uncharacterized protein [Manis javanica]|uniref:uncharacterized protein n=1 Tax=Manis javanica TaxID=9974 RepID=UPI003C6DB706